MVRPLGRPLARRAVLDREITEPSDLRWADLQAFVLDRRRRGFAANTWP